MFIPGAIELILVVGVLLFVGFYLVSFFRKKDAESKESLRGKILGCGIGVVILFGIGIGLFKLSNPPFLKSGAIAIESTTRLPAGVTQPEQFNYYIQTYRGAIILDAWSLRLVFPGRGSGSIFGEGKKMGSHSIGKNVSNWSVSMTQTPPFYHANIELGWSSPEIVADGDGKGILTVSIDEAVVNIKDGIAEIDGFRIPATGPVQVVFLDPLGGVEEILQQHDDETANQGR